MNEFKKKGYKNNVAQSSILKLCLMLMIAALSFVQGKLLISS